MWESRGTDTFLRNQARAFEEALSPSQRKALGQYFTGMPLGRMLAHLAITNDTKYILDPMAGSGDLLDAALEAAASRDIELKRLDGIEIDGATASFCRERLQHICAETGTRSQVIYADAFDASHNGMSSLESAYDLVITNPPYVRYQALNGRAEHVRSGLCAAITHRLTGFPLDLWMRLVKGYSGLADLSVPAWLLSASMVKPGGRLALVVPATWRSRGYADVIRYLLIRCFRLEIIVEDTQPGWFSDALVRTHLIVARRLHEEEIADSLNERANFPVATWVQVAPDAATNLSLVGNAFDSELPEAAFASWCYSSDRRLVTGIISRKFSLEDEWQALRAQASERPWVQALEQSTASSSLSSEGHSIAVPVPEALRDLLPISFDRSALDTLNGMGIFTGQGLRTGCNRFFYVQFVEQISETVATVVTAKELGARTIEVPTAALQPVLHRQADLTAWRLGVPPMTRVLDLRYFVLPEDMESVTFTAQQSLLGTVSLPEVMPDQLADYVREASNLTVGKGAQARPISTLSAVKTNVRAARRGSLARFWYMLPDFMPRHLPQAFVPRIIHREPFVYANATPPILIDANFSTFWSEQSGWTAAGLEVFLNSTWSRTIMESVGTPLGGGALKLEAAHLRKMPVPRLSQPEIDNLNTIGNCAPEKRDMQSIDRIIVRSILLGAPSDSEIDSLSALLNDRRLALSAARQRGAI